MASLKAKLGGAGVLNTIDSLAGGFAQGYHIGSQLQQQREAQDLKNKMLQLHIDQINRQVEQQQQNKELFESIYPSEGHVADITRDIYNTPHPGELPSVLTPQPPPEELTGTPTTVQQRIPLTPIEQLTKAAGQQETPATAVGILREAQKAERESRMQALYEQILGGNGPGGLMGLETTGMHMGPQGPSFTFGKRVPPDPLKDLTPETKELVIKGLNAQGLAYKDFNSGDPQHQQLLDNALTSVQQNRDTTRQMKEESQALREALGSAHLLISQQGLELRKQGTESKLINISPQGQITNDPSEAALTIPSNSPQFKALGPSNMVYNHLQQGLDAYKNLMDKFAGDRNRLFQYLKSSVNVLKNDPDAVKLFNFLEGPNALAIGNLYTGQGAGNGLRNSARLATILMPSGIQKGDNIITMAESKFQPMAELNLGNVSDMGLPQGKFQTQLAEIKSLGQQARQISGVPQRPEQGKGRIIPQPGGKFTVHFD